VGDSSPVRKGTSPNSPRIRHKVRVRVSDRVSNRDNLHLWLWWIMAMAVSGYGGLKTEQKFELGLVLLQTSDRLAIYANDASNKLMKYIGERASEL